MKIVSGASALLAILLLCFSCTKHDPTYDDVQPPTISVENSVILGLVTDYQGNILSNAVIDVNGQEIRTDEEGMYRYEIIKEGEYEVSASYPEKISKKATVTVPSVAVTQTFIQNFILPENRTVVIQTGENENQTESIPGNELEGTMTVSVEIEEALIPEDAYLTLTPVYSQQDGEDMAQNQTKASSAKTESKMLVGALIACSDPSVTELAKTAKLKFDLKKEVQGLTKLMMFDRKENKWAEIGYESFDDGIVFEIKQLTTYGVFGDLKITIQESSQAITDFTPQSFWDNYYGKDVMHVDKISFTTKMGMILDNTQGVDQLHALLLEKLAQDYGLGSEKLVTSTYNVNVDLPIGTSLEIMGTQTKLSVIYEMNGKSVHADTYGSSTVSCKTYNRKHTGGGNYVNY